jgi:hypothetical protein
VLWNLLNTLVLFFAIRNLPEVRPRSKALILWFIFLEMLGSIQNAQSNALMAGLIVAGFNAKHSGKEWAAALFIMLSTFVKIYGAVALVLWLIYPGKARYALYTILWALLLFAAPLVVVSPRHLIFLYSSWVHLLQADHVGLNGLSVQGQLYFLFGRCLPDTWVMLSGALLFLLPFVRIRSYGATAFRILILASSLVWVIIFNHRAESPTFIIAITGVALWYFTQPKTALNLTLLVIAFVFSSLSPTDIFPPWVRHHIFQPYSVKVMPCILVWVKIEYDLLFSRFQKDTASTSTIGTVDKALLT